ncbi:MAG: cation:proton antiporter [Chlorobiaceae bacterium]|nr:cation:proton antiporter [Chlorobiaceae bacterium]
MGPYYEQLLREFHLPLTNPVLVFSLVLFIILLSPILLKRINIPGTVGLIISGVIIGPHSLNLLEKSSAVDLFSTIGLLYIMFIAGLELDVNEFRKHRHKSILFGLLTFTLPIGIGFPVCRYLLNYDVSASFLTASMFATHTLVAYPIVSRMGVSKNQAVAVTVGGTILTDTAVLVILAIILGYSQGNVSQDFLIQLSISLAVFVAIVFLMIPAVARWFFSNLENEKYSHYIFVLAVVFFSAFLAKLAGIEPIVGAFAAGLALNPLIPNSSALMNRIEFIGNALFIPFFLISVGMLVDVRVLFNGPMAMMIAATLTIVALLGKWVAALVTQQLFRYSADQRQLIFGLSSSHAAATIAVILVGYQARILDLNILNGTIVLILVTCVVASFVTERAAKRIVLESSPDLPADLAEHELSNERILLPIIDTQSSEKLLELAIMIKEKESPNPLTVLTVVPDDEQAELNVQRARIELEPMVRHAASFDATLNVIATIDYNICSGVGRSAKELMSDIIIFGWPHRRGFIGRMINDTTESFIGCTSKTTLVCHFSRPLAMHRRIVVVCPPFAEKEKGFGQWVGKVSRIALELSIPVVCHCDRKSRSAVISVLREIRSGVSIDFESFRNFREWEALTAKSAHVREDDLFIFVASRPESVSYRGFFEHIPDRLEAQFNNVSKIMLYPARFESREQAEGYVDIVAIPFSFSRSAVQKIGRELGGFLKTSSLPIKRRTKKNRRSGP